MRITCFIRYEIDPFQREAFAAYARRWPPSSRAAAATARLLPAARGHQPRRLGADLVRGLAAYEAYRTRLKADAEGRANFEFAQRNRFILREERSFLETVQP